jgi:hypothetical protein
MVRDNIFEAQKALYSQILTGETWVPLQNSCALQGLETHITYTSKVYTKLDTGSCWKTVMIDQQATWEIWLRFLNK